MVMMVRRRFVAVALGVLATAFPFALAPSTSAAEAAAGLAVGQTAPTFRLQNQNGEWMTLEQQRGKWLVLYFYPKDNTPGCTTQACEFRDNIFAYRKAGAVILGVSVDDLASHKKFAEEHSLPFPILADADKRIAQRYGVLYKAMGIMEIARRETFIIDPVGRIAKHYKTVTPKGHSELVLADLRALQAKGQ
jgi:peroxiredoxin Q/BCP